MGKSIGESIKIFSGSAGVLLAEEVCKILSVPIGVARVGRFLDGEIDVRILEEVQGADVYVINGTHAPAENLIELGLLIDALKNSSPKRITLILPYLGYNRQNRTNVKNLPVSAKVLIDFLARRGAETVLLFDLHDAETVTHFQPLTTYHLHAAEVVIPYLAACVPEPFVVAAADKGGSKRAGVYAKLLGKGGPVYFSKNRSPETGSVLQESIGITGNVKDHNVLFIDDMIDSGGTMIADAIAAKKAGAKDIYAFATHALFSGDAIARLDQSPIKEVIVTTTIPHNPESLAMQNTRLTMLSIAPVIASAIKKIHANVPLLPQVEE